MAQKQCINEKNQLKTLRTRRCGRWTGHTASFTKTDGTVVAGGVADVTLRYKNITQVTTTNADGSTSTTQVTMPAQPKGEQFEGTDGNDAAFGTAGNDRIVTGLGNDVIVDDLGDDVAEAGAGDGYSQKRSGLSPYDADIGQINLRNWKIKAKTGRKPETPRVCQRAGSHEKPIFEGKNKQCQRHMVIVRSEKYSTSSQQNGKFILTTLGGGV